jgi:hypothetical protein
MPRRLVSRAWAALVLAVVLGILPLPSQALPLGSGTQPPPALRLEPLDWLSRLERVLDSLWKKATAQTGMSIDPNGRPDSQPGDQPSGDGDTGKSIDPNG